MANKMRVSIAHILRHNYELRPVVLCTSIKGGRQSLQVSCTSNHSSQRTPAMIRTFSSAASRETSSKSSFDVFAKLKDPAGANDSKSNLKRKPSDRVLQLADSIMSLTLIEAADLCDLCQERLSPGDGSPIPGRMPFPHPMAMFGAGGAGMMHPGAAGGGMVMPQMPMPAQAATTPAAAPGAEEDASSDDGDSKPAEKAAPQKKAGPVTLKLISFEAAKKIATVKEVRGLTALGIKESKDLVEGVPKVLKKAVPPEEAEAIIQKFKDLGAVVQVAE